MTSHVKALILTCEGTEVRLNGHLIGYGPMHLDRKTRQNIEAAEEALADLLRERLDWPQDEERA